MRNPNAPLHAATPRRDPAIPAPPRLLQNGTTRRGFLGGAAAFWATGARAERLTLTVGPSGYNGASPGPILRTRAGAPLELALVNGLDRPTSLRLPGFLSGALAPGARRELSVAPASGFDLYGPFDPPGPAPLFGAVIAGEPNPPPVDLDAVALLSDGETVNGRPGPLVLEARPGARVRLRIANAAPDLAFPLRASGADARIAAIDGRPSELFAPRDGAFPVCPGARFELMFDLDAPFELTAPERVVVRLAPRGEPLPKRPPLAPLPADPRLPADIALERARQVKIVVGAAALNGTSGKTLFKAAVGTPVALTLVNPTAQAETLRLEAHAARILHALDDGWDPYWRDVLYVAPGQTLHAAFVPQARGRWPLASVSAEKRARGLLGWFEVG